MKEQPIEDVLQVTERLALTADEAAGIVALHFQQQSFLQVMFFDDGVEAEVLQQLFERVFRLCSHNSSAECRMRNEWRIGQVISSSWAEATPVWRTWEPLRCWPWSISFAQWLADFARSSKASSRRRNCKG